MRTERHQFRPFLPRLAALFSALHLPAWNQISAFYGLVYLLVLFVGVIAYAFWPGNKRKFDDAARRALEED